VQFAILNALLDEPGIDQVTLAQRVALDPATSGSVIERLERKGWLRREPAPTDRRRRLLWITPTGMDVVQALMQPIADAQARLLAPLPPADAQALLRLLKALVSAHPR